MFQDENNSIERLMTPVYDKSTFPYSAETRVGDNNFQSKSPTANGLIIQLLTFSELVHGKSTNTHTRALHNVSPLYTLYYEYVAHSALAI